MHKIQRRKPAATASNHIHKMSPFVSIDDCGNIPTYNSCSIGSAMYDDNDPFLMERTSYATSKFSHVKHNHQLLALSKFVMTITIATFLMICSFLLGFGMAFQPLQHVVQPLTLDQKYDDSSSSSHSRWYSVCQRKLGHDRNYPNTKSWIFMQSTVYAPEYEDDRQIHLGVVDTESSRNVNRVDLNANTNIATKSINQSTAAKYRRGPLTSSSFKDQIQKCKSSVNIVDVIESYQLDQFARTSGTDRAIAVCPFHDDHNPSLHIDSTKQIFKCFACNAGGDVIHFVQEYSKLPINCETPELSFIQALQHINRKYGDGTLMFAMPKQTNDSTRTPVESAAMTHKKERITLANVYAAIYYSNCLKETYAGGARYYLRSTRGLSLPVFKTMMIGFAPDTYYDHRFTFMKNHDRPISLVNHLVQSGFTPQEIVDAGLALIGKNHSISHSTTNSANHSDTMVVEPESINSNMLMDRFRGRIMIPILDESGTNIIGFGGRTIPPPPESNDSVVPSSNFKAPKYLNSPESLVFEKRKILFNQNLAFKAIHTDNRNAPTLPLILVEGYMDVISLWEIGIYNVAASMGTAISPEQLDQASKTAGCRGGKIVLCLDNDDAGAAAIERLCRNGIFEDCTKMNSVSIHVTRLPKHVKDPSDFIESRRTLGISVQQLAADFCCEVVANAVDWTEWYIQHLISGYDQYAPRGTAGSFSDAFERIAEFLANSFTPAERTKVAYSVAGQLSRVLANERNSTEISLSVRIQLESDLIDLASRLSAAKEVLQRRINAASSVSTSASPPPTVASFARGQGPNSFDHDVAKLSRNATRTNDNVRKQSIAPIVRHTPEKIKNIPAVQPTRTVPRQKVHTSRAIITRHREPNFVSVTTHFSGFQFKHQSDMDWLGLQNNKLKRAKFNPLVLGQYQQTTSKNLGDTKSLRDKQVYFNSAGFNGYQFLTDSAIDAGYTARSFKPDKSLIINGLSSIVEQDVNSMLESAEDTLLQILVNDGAARSVVKNMLNARHAVNCGGDIQWSTPDKRWLFELLVFEVNVPNQFNSTGTARNKLYSFLAHHPNAPPGAFSQRIDETIAHAVTILPSEVSESDLSTTKITAQSDTTISTPIAMISLLPMNDDRGLQDTIPTIHSSSGTLDLFFEDDLISSEKHLPGDSVVGTRNELAVQETLVSLLWASTLSKSKMIQAELISYAESITMKEVSFHETEVDHNEQHSVNATIEESLSSSSSSYSESVSMQLLWNNTSSDKTTKVYDERNQSELLTHLRDTTQTLYALKESSNRIALRLLDESSSTGVEGSISQALQTDLASKLDDHVRDVCQNDLCPKPGLNDIPYEIELERMAEDWGDWYDDDYVWTSGESTKVATNIKAESQIVDDESDLERETLDDFFERVDREWRGWDD